MKNVFLLLFLVLISIGFNACIKEPEFSEVPKITFQNISYSQSDINDSDTLFITVAFEDGDGDLGLNPTELDPPYHSMDLFLKSSGAKVPYSTGAINNELYKSIDDAGLPPYNCDNYTIYRETRITDEDTILVVDTLYVEFNPLRVNYYVDFEIKNASGNFVPYNFISSPGQCPTGFNDRFYPLFDDINNDRPLSGTLRRKITSRFGLPEELYLREDILKVKVYIFDRAGNQSNIAESNEFTLKQIEIQ